MKYIQNIRPEEHILVAVTTNKPWDVDQKSLLGAFGRVLVTSTPDYSSRYLLFKEIMDGHGIPTDIHSSVSLSCLARYSSGYSFADIIACCNDVIAPRRLKQVQHFTYKKLISLVKI